SQLVPGLEQNKKHVWFDKDDIEAGSMWRERISTGIRRARTFVFVVSPGSLESRWCRDELAEAVALGKPLVPIVRIGVPDGQVPAELAKVQWIDFTESAAVDGRIEQVADAINADRWWRDRHNELTIQAHDWLEGGRDKSTLLRGTKLKEAEEKWLV